MSEKTKVNIDAIPKGVVINSRNEINYTAQIAVDLNRDVNFEYAIVDEDFDENTFIPYTSAKKFVLFKHTNSDGSLKKKLLLLKCPEKCVAEVSIDIVPFLVNSNSTITTYQQQPMLETLGPRGTVLLNSTAANGGKDEPWYKNPLILIGLFLAVILAVIFLMKRNSNNNNRGSIFVD